MNTTNSVRVLRLPQHTDAIIRGVCNEVGVNLEMGISPFLGIMSTLCQAKFEVQCEVRNGLSYHVPLSSFSFLIADSGSGKGPVFKKFLTPLDELIVAKNLEVKADRDRVSIHNDIIDAKSKALKKEALKAKSCDLAELQRELVELSRERMTMPSYVDMYTNNGTEAGLRKLIANQEGNRAAILDSEGSSLKMLISDPKLPSMLNQAYDRETISAARKDSPDNPPLKGSVSMAVAMQPTKLSDLDGQNHIWDEGLLPRVLPFFPHRLNFAPQPEPMEAQVLSRYKEKLEQLFLYAWKRDNKGLCVPHTLRLSEEAIVSWVNERQRLERLANTELSDIKSWVMKAPMTILRVAAILHLYECEGDPLDSEITHELIGYAAEMIDYVIPTVCKLREKVAPAPEEIATKKVINWLYFGKHAIEFDFRDIYRGAGLKTELVIPVVKTLVAQNVLTQDMIQRLRRVGRPGSERFTLNVDALNQLYPI